MSKLRTGRVHSRRSTAIGVVLIGLVQILLEAEKGPYQFEISADGYQPARILVPSQRTLVRGVIQLDQAAK